MNKDYKFFNKKEEIKYLNILGIHKRKLSLITNILVDIYLDDVLSYIANQLKKTLLLTEDDLYELKYEARNHIIKETQKNIAKNEGIIQKIKNR